MTDLLTPDAERLAPLREALPATGAGIYLDTATRGPLPAETAAAMREADEWELRVGRVSAGRDDDVTQRAAEARAVLAAALGGDPAEIALMPGLEVALAVAAWAPKWSTGDRALTVAQAGRETLAVLHALREHHGVELDVAQWTDTDGLAAAVSPRTRLVIVPHVSSSTGELLPVADIAATVRASDAWLVVDASHSAGAVAIDAGRLGADFVALAADKWLLAPEATAALWAGERALTEARPWLAGVAADKPLESVIGRGRPDARRFEPATLARTSMLGLARSVGWLEMYVGLPWALPRGQQLARTLHRALSATDGVEVLTPAGPMANIVTFRLPAWPAAEVADELGRRVFAIVRPLPEVDAARASTAWFNTEEELARFAGAVGELARHTPQTLPRRPSLTVLGDG